MVRRYRRKKSISLSRLMEEYCLILIVLNVPYLQLVFPISNFIKLSLYIFGVVCGCLLVWRYGKVKPTAIILGIMYLTFIFSTIVNNGNIHNCVQRISLPVMVLLLFASTTSNRHLQIISHWKNVLLVLVGIDIISMFMFPEGMYKTLYYTNNWFLGYKTERLVYSFTLFIMCAYLDAVKSNIISLKTLIIGAAVCWNSMRADGSMATFSLLIYWIIILLTKIYFHNRNKQEKLGKFLYSIANYKIIISVYVIAMVYLVFDEQTNMLSTLVSVFFGKNSTFTNRTVIWAALLLKIVSKPILGLGWLTGEEYVNISHMYGATNAHNFILSILVTGGIMALAEFIGLNILVLRKRDRTYSIEVFVLISSIYTSLLLGLSSSILFYSPFAFIVYMLLEDKL